MSDSKIILYGSIIGVIAYCIGYSISILLSLGWQIGLLIGSGLLFICVISLLLLPKSTKNKIEIFLT